MKNRFRGLSESRKMEMLQMSVEEIYNAGCEEGQASSKVDELRKQLGIKSPADYFFKPKSPNQRRAELIQRDREFVEFKKRFLINSEEIEGGYQAKKRENPVYVADISTVDFVVNAEKRTVVAILKGLKTGRLISKGIAKCHPDEVFHADIGKAIALARALEIEIPQEFLEAVQPDAPVVGMIVKGVEGRTVKFTNKFYHASVYVPAFNIEGLPDNHYALSSAVAKIMDDSAAEYEVPSC